MIRLISLIRISLIRIPAAIALVSAERLRIPVGAAFIQRPSAVFTKSGNTFIHRPAEATFFTGVLTAVLSSVIVHTVLRGKAILRQLSGFCLTRIVTCRVLIRIIRYLLEYKWIVFLLLICSFFSNIGNLMGPRFAGKAISVAEEGYKAGVGKIDMDLVRHYAMLMLGLYVGSNILSFLISIGMPEDLESLGADSDDIPKLVKQLCYGDGRDGTISGFITLDEEACTKIYKMMI